MAGLRPGLRRAAPRRPRSWPGSSGIGTGAARGGADRVTPVKAGVSGEKSRRVSRDPGFRRDDASRLKRRGGAREVGEPGAGLALGLGDLAGGHVFGDVGAAFLGDGAAVQGGEVEPFVRFDEVDLDAADAGRISDAQLVERLDVPHRRVASSGSRPGRRRISDCDPCDRAPYVNVGTRFAPQMPTNG